MKISAISNHQAFRGLFVDKTKNEEWVMEYHPYSWETFHNTAVHRPYYDVRKPIMENKQQIDILASKLPDNEEIYIPMTKETPAISKDILGTVSYYEYPVEVKLGEFRNKITESSPMNLEESLKVYLKKNEKFRDMKQEEMQKTAKDINESLDRLKKDIGKCRDASYRSEGFHIFSDASNERSRKFFDLEYDTMQKHKALVEKYIKLAETKEDLDKFISDLRKELKLIDKKKKSGDIIDISVRHEFDPNKALYEEGMKLAEKPNEIQKTSKLVLLSHRAVPLKEIIQEWIQYTVEGKSENIQKFIKQLPEGLTRIADLMISFRR